MNDDRTVWYRKWRPQTFAEITGQDHVTRTLRNAVASGRIAHAYLLCGPRGIGKTTSARVLAKAVNCANPVEGEPCDRCESCVAVREGRALDLVEMDAASNRGIDDIRELRDRVGYAAAGGRYKVYLIDEVHELTQQAFDALLKTLEEPPPHVIFVLATTDAHRVPATIVSRCQRFDLTRARPDDLAAHLRQIAGAEGVTIDDDALAVVARAATGSFRDGTGLLEQLVAAYGRTITAEQARVGLGLAGDARALELARMAIDGDLAGGLSLIAAIRDDGADLRQFTREVAARLRSVLLLRAGVEDAGLDANLQVQTRELAAHADLPAITRALKAFGSADFRADPQASLPLELALVEVALRPEPAEPQAPAFAEARRTHRSPDPAPAAPNPPAIEPAASADQKTVLLEKLARPSSNTTPSPPVAPTNVEAVLPPTSAPVAPPHEDAVAMPDDEPNVAQAEPETLEPTHAGGQPSLSEARSRYRDIYQRLRAIRRSAAHINPGDIVAIDAESVTFGFPYPVQVAKFTPGSDNLRALAEAVAQVLGRTYAVHCIQQSDVEDRLKAQPSRPSHLLDEALKLGARPLNGS
ncbi:MAG: DNA polymerase III subunit gamma/tau [Dehalococcoidia bacterium]